MTTKEQERAALEQIKKIMASLDADSYINTAFSGCLEMAESNIENDWACSMKDRAETAEKKVKKLELDNRDLRDAIKRIKEENSKKITALEARTLSDDDLYDCKLLAETSAYEHEKDMKSAALDIVALADEPENANFQDAVKKHRAAQSALNYALGLKGRIEKAMQKA